MSETQTLPTTEEMEAQQDLTEQIAQGHDAELVATLLSDQLTKRRQQIEKEVFKILEADGSILAGEKAIQCWIELHAVHRLEQHLRRRVQVGEAASKRIRGQLQGPDEEPIAPRRRRFIHA